MTAGQTYAFVVTMNDNLNFDEGSVTYTSACVGTGDPGGPLTETGAVLIPHLYTPPNACCPPWNQQTLSSSLAYQGGPGGITAPYGLIWQPPSTLNGQMAAYINYLHALNPAITSITISFALYPAGTGATPGSPGAEIGQPVSGTWTAGSVLPTGSTNFLPQGVMQVGTWYTVGTTVSLNDGITFFSDDCANQAFSMRVQVATRAAGVGGKPAVEVRPAPGKIGAPLARGAGKGRFASAVSSASAVRGQKAET